MASLTKDLRRLIEQIEAWPSVLPAPPPKSKLPHKEEQDPLEPPMAGRSAPAPPPLRLTSSLNRPTNIKPHQLPSMASAVPQRTGLWPPSALSSNIGPQTFDNRVEAMVVHSPSRVSPFMKGPSRPQEGAPSSRARVTGALGGDPFVDPGSLYADRADPRRIDLPAVPGVSFASFTHRFGPDEHLRHLEQLHQPRVPRRPTLYHPLAPRWDGPFVGVPEPLVLPPDHAERLARARAEGGYRNVKPADKPDKEPDAKASE